MPTFAHDPNLTTHCAIAARQHDTPLYGTAPHVDAWFLLEYPYPWGSHPTTENDLPPAIQDALQTQLENIPNSRLQFIKHDDHPTLDDLTLYIALVDDQQPTLYKIPLSSINDLLELDFAVFLKCEPSVAEYRTAKPLFLICTNTRRNSCCARGLPIYEALRQHEAIEVWQTTHVGGHRYAATLIALPHSIYYGHVETEDVSAIVAAQSQDKVYLPKMRGRTCYEPVVQAAEYFLRKQQGITAHEALQLEKVTNTPNDDQWLVSFRADGRLYELHIAHQLADYQLPKSCNKEQAPVYEYRLIDIQES